jgi:predicted RNA-binding protein with PIN domain
VTELGRTTSAPSRPTGTTPAPGTGPETDAAEGDGVGPAVTAAPADGARPGSGNSAPAAHGVGPAITAPPADGAGPGSGNAGPAGEGVGPAVTAPPADGAGAGSGNAGPAGDGVGPAVTARPADGAGPGADSGGPAGNGVGSGTAGAAREAGATGPGPGGDGVGDSAGEVGEPVLPEAVRARVLALASAALGRMPVEEIPAPLRAAARFTPTKRVKLAGSALAAVLSTDAVFRLRAAEQVERESPAAVEAARSGVLPGAADPVELAAVAYLLRPPAWTDMLERSRTALDELATRSRDRARDQELDALRADAAAARAAEREQAQKSRTAAEAARADAETLRRQLREQTGQRRAAERARTAAEEALAEERRRAAAEDSRAQAEIRRLRQRLAEAEDAVEAGRRVARETRQADRARLWLLLETATGAVQGLRRELALTPTDERPADSVAAGTPAPPDVLGARGDDPERVDRLLELPHVHLVVDGYNVTKTGYGELPLAAQRSRLIRGLAALAARTGAEVTVVFDGSTRPPAMPPVPRGVRVLFSAPGEIADDLIRRLVAAEPEGRPVVVVSTDREVATDVTRAGAYAVASALLLRRLDRG